MYNPRDDYSYAGSPAHLALLAKKKAEAEPKRSALLSCKDAAGLDKKLRRELSTARKAKRRMDKACLKKKAKRAVSRFYADLIRKAAGVRKLNHWIVKKKIACRAETMRFLRRGDLVRDTCRLCGAPQRTGLHKLHAHHWHYGRPLHVWFVCMRCHLTIHRVLLAVQRAFQEETPATSMYCGVFSTNET